MRLQQALTFVLLIGFAASSHNAKAAGTEVNFLFIYTDDQSHRTVGCYEDAYEWARTPHIDALAAQGVRFSRAYIGAWCMPSRATILTGHHQHGIESMRMEGQYPGSAYDPEKCPFWPSDFRKRGYHTAQIGKWHTGIDTGHGRDWDFQMVWNRPGLPDNAPNYYYDQKISVNGGEPKLTKGYSTDNYTDWAVDYINGKNRTGDKPWFLWLCYGAVHGPFTPADRHLNDYPNARVDPPAGIYPPREGKPEYMRTMEFWEKGKDGQPVERKVRDKIPVGMKDMPGRPLRDWVRQYHQGVRAIDEGVGRLIKALKDSGQYGNTVIIFTSDQGFAWGQLGSKSKVAPYKATVAAPLIIVPAGDLRHRTAGKVIQDPVSGVDLPPTIYQLAGMSHPWAFHGRSLMTFLARGHRASQAPAMLVHTAKQYGSNTAVIPPKGDPKATHGPGVPWYVMLAEGRYKYIRNLVEGEVEELYEVRKDSDEMKNLAVDQDHQEVLKEYRAKAVAELKRTKAPFVDAMPKASTMR